MARPKITRLWARRAVFAVVGLVATMPGCGADVLEDPDARVGKNEHVVPRLDGLCLAAGTPTTLAGNHFVGRLSQQDAFGNDRWGVGYLAGVQMEGWENGGLHEATRTTAWVTTAAKLFGTDVDLVAAFVEAASERNKDSAVYAHLLFGGRYVYPLFAFTGDFEHARAFSHPVLSVTTRWEGLDLGFSLWATLGYAMQGQLTPNGVTMSVQPLVRLDAMGIVAAGGRNVRGELRGAVSLLEVSLPSEATLLAALVGTQLQFEWSAHSDLVARSLDGSVTATLENRFDVAKVEEVLADWDGADWDEALFDGSGQLRVYDGQDECGVSNVQRAARPIGPLADPSLEPRAVPLASLLEEIAVEAGHSEVGVAPAALVFELSQRVASDPETIAELSARARGGGPAAAPLLAALGAANVPEATRSLLDLADHEEVPAHIRVEAIAAAGLSTAVDADTAAKLLALAVEDGIVAEAAAYATGNVARTLRADDPAAAARLTDALMERLSGTTEPARRAIATAALANARAPVARDRLRDLAASDEEAPQVRRVAAVGLHALGEPVPDGLLPSTRSPQAGIVARP